MEKIKLHDLEFEKFISIDEINLAVDKVARQVNEEYKNDVPLVLVALNGAMIFAAELLQKMTMPCYVSGVKVASYCGTQSTNVIKSIIGINEDVKDRRVLIVEDIIDTGKTYEYLWQELTSRGVKDVKIATLTFKKEAYQKELPIDFVGMVVPNKFVVGHGLDYDGLGRNLPDIYQVTK